MTHERQPKTMGQSDLRLFLPHLPLFLLTSICVHSFNVSPTLILAHGQLFLTLIYVSSSLHRIAMSLDDVEIGNSRLAKGSNTIEAPTEGGLYLGGLPSALTLNGRAGTRESLRGVIRDLVYNRKTYKFNNPVKFEAVSIGREADPDVFVNLGYEKFLLYTSNNTRVNSNRVSTSISGSNF